MLLSNFQNNVGTFGDKNQRGEDDIVAKGTNMADNDNRVVIQVASLIFLLLCWDSFGNIHGFIYKCNAGTFDIGVEKGVEEGTWTFTICPGVEYGGKVVLRQLTRSEKWYEYVGDAPAMQLPHLQVNHKCDSDPICFRALHCEVESYDQNSSIQFYGLATYLKVQLPFRWNWRSYRYWHDVLDQAERERIAKMVELIA